MTRRVITTGADHWNARSGYKRSPRVPGPIQPMERPRGEPSLLEGILTLALVLVVGALLIVAFGGN